MRVLGPEKFGLVAFAQALIQYFMTFTDYGFNLSATRKISIHREDRGRVSQVFSSVISIKFTFMLISLLVLMGLVFAVPKFSANWIIYLFAFGTVIGNVFFPVWFFQGMERMKYITFLNLLARSIFTAAIFVFIRKQADYIYVPLITSSGFISAGILSLWIVWKDFKVRFNIPSLADIIEELRDGWHVFLSTVSFNVYSTSNTFFIGMLFNYSMVGYYNAAEKIINALRNLLGIVFQVFYPSLSRLAAENRRGYLRRWSQLFLMVLALSLVMLVSIFFLSEEITALILSHDFIYSSYIMKFLAFSIVLRALMALFGMEMMLVLGLLRVYSLSFITISSIYIILSPFILKFIGMTGLLVFLLFTELSIALFRLCYLQYWAGIPVVASIMKGASALR